MPEGPDISAVPEPPRLEHQLVALVSNIRNFYMWCRANQVGIHDPNLIVIRNATGFSKRMEGFQWREGDRLVVFKDTDSALVLAMAQYRDAQQADGQYVPTPEWFE